MSDTLADLMLRNLSEVFGERDSERRMAAIKNLYSEDAVFFEAEQRFDGRQKISDAVAALQASFPAEFQRGPPTLVIDAGGRTGIPGLNDSHLHLIRGGLNYNMELHWDGVPSLADALRMLKEQTRETP
jgi:hypothetical protein